MAQYIDKDALIAEIKRLKNHYNSAAKEFGDEGYKDNVLMEQCKATVCERVLSFINSLEVKEVDLEKEIDKFYGIYRKNEKTYSTKDNEECLDWKVDCNPEFEIAFAKHFFEFGMSVSNKAQKGE